MLTVNELRGRIDAGLAAPAQVRLEGFPPLSFGAKPFFVMVARGDEATLLLPRDGRVLRGSPPPAIIEALAGVSLAAAELRSVLAGCGSMMNKALGGGITSTAPGWVDTLAQPFTSVTVSCTAKSPCCV